MRVWMQISALALSAALLAGCGAQTVSAAEPIGIDAAKAAALEDAGVNAADASFTTAELERKGELEYYDVDFTVGGQSYEYDIDAITGVVIAREGGQHGEQTTGAANGLIGEAEAKAKALAHAGLQESQVTFLRAELDQDDGRQVYEVEFYTQDGKEYDYEIDAAAGEILSYDYDAETSVPTAGTASGQTITQAEAKAKALAHAGLKESQVTFLRAELDRDDGRQVYEVEFYTQDYKEYDYEIDAATVAHAGLKESQVTFLRAELDRDDGRQVYEVEFYTQDYKEYDYEIDAATGEVLSYDYDAETDFQTGTSSGKELTAAEAKALALSQVPGATEADIREFSTDRDDGRLEYEGEIHYDGVSYEFEIDGYSGAIRNWEVEKSGW